MWLEVTAKDAKGNVLMTTGTVDAEGTLPDNIRMFNSEGQDDRFHFAIDPWKVQSFSRHDTIPPKGFKDVYYGLTAEKNRPIYVEAKLRYRQAEQKVAEKLLGLVPGDIHLDAIYGIKEVPILPVIDMVSKNTCINGANLQCD